MGRVLIDESLNLPVLGDGHHVSPKSVREGIVRNKKGRAVRRLCFPDSGFAHDSDIIALARIFHDFLQTVLPDRFRGSGQPTYLDLYHHMDIDGSGTVDFDEYEHSWLKPV